MDPVTLSIIAGTKLAGGIVDYYRGNKKEKAAQARIDAETKKLERIEYTNRFADLQVPTKAFDMQSQERLSEMANIADVAKQAGPEGIAMLTGASREADRQRQQDAARLDKMELAVDAQVRQGQTDVDLMNKEFQKQLGFGQIAGARAEQQVGRDLKQAGVEGMTGAATGLIGAGYGAMADDPYIVDTFAKGLGFEGATPKDNEQGPAPTPNPEAVRNLMIALGQLR